MGSEYERHAQPFTDQIRVTPVRLLPRDTNEVERWMPKLPPDEISDARSMGSVEARRRFIQCRLILRLLLGSHFGNGWYASPFEYGSGGKPALPAESPVQFNIAHSGDLAIFALSHSSSGAIQIGVDVECMRPRPNGMELARRFFHPDEIAHLASLPDDRRDPEFLQIWVRKEACLKAVGTGIAGNLGSFSVKEASGHVLLPSSQAIWFQELRIATPAYAALASTGPLPPIFVAPLQTAQHHLDRLSDQDHGSDHGSGPCTSSGSSSSHSVASCD
jgi:4'-phosphopantetheinyl transferase